MWGGSRRRFGHADGNVREQSGCMTREALSGMTGEGLFFVICSSRGGRVSGPWLLRGGTLEAGESTPGEDFDSDGQRRFVEIEARVVMGLVEAFGGVA